MRAARHGNLLNSQDVGERRRWAAAGPRSVFPRCRPSRGSGVDHLALAGLAVEGVPLVAAADGDLARLGLFGHRDVQPQHALVVRGLNAIGVEVLAQNQLPTEY